MKNYDMPELPLTEWQPPETKLTDEQVKTLAANIGNCENVAELVGVFKSTLAELIDSPIYLAIKAAIAG